MLSVEEVISNGRQIGLRIKADISKLIGHITNLIRNSIDYTVIDLGQAPSGGFTDSDEKTLFELVGQRYPNNFEEIRIAAISALLLIKNEYAGNLATVKNMDILLEKILSSRSFLPDPPENIDAYTEQLNTYLSEKITPLLELEYYDTLLKMKPNQAVDPENQKLMNEMDQRLSKDIFNLIWFNQMQAYFALKVQRMKK